jgi:hypothetical protein
VRSSGIFNSHAGSATVALTNNFSVIPIAAKEDFVVFILQRVVISTQERYSSFGHLFKTIDNETMRFHHRLHLSSQRSQKLSCVFLSRCIA